MRGIHLLAATAVTAAFALGGCTVSPSVSPVPSSASTASSAVSGAPRAQTATSATAPSGTATANPATDVAPAAKPVVKVWHPSPKALAYAKRIGGGSHSGERLYFVIGDSVGSEREAQALLDRAIPKFGDMQSYFIVQRSDNFEGMRAGWWVVIEAYRKPPSTENLQFGRRGFPGAYVKRAIVHTTDPIPVYDDLVAQ